MRVSEAGRSGRGGHIGEGDRDVAGLRRTGRRKWRCCRESPAFVRSYLSGYPPPQRSALAARRGLARLPHGRRANVARTPNPRRVSGPRPPGLARFGANSCLAPRPARRLPPARCRERRARLDLPTPRRRGLRRSCEARQPRFYHGARAAGQDCGPAASASSSSSCLPNSQANNPPDGAA